MTKTRNVEKVILKYVGLEKRGKGEVEKGVYKSYVALKAGQVRGQELRSFRFRARQFLREVAERCQCFLRREGGEESHPPKEFWRQRRALLPLRCLLCEYRLLMLYLHERAMRENKDSLNRILSVLTQAKSSYPKAGLAEEPFYVEPRKKGGGKECGKVWRMLRRLPALAGGSWEGRKGR